MIALPVRCVCTCFIATLAGLHSVVSAARRVRRTFVVVLLATVASAGPAVAQQTVRTAAEGHSPMRFTGRESASGEGRHCIVMPELRVPLVGLRDPLDMQTAGPIARTLVTITIDKRGVVRQARIAGEGDPVCYDDVLRYVRSVQFRPHRADGTARERMIVSVFTQRRGAS